MSSACVPVANADTQGVGGYACNARVPVRVRACFIYVFKKSVAIRFAYQ